MGPDSSGVDLDRRPVLVRLRGGPRTGWHRSIVPTDSTGTLDAVEFTSSQARAVTEAARSDHFAVAGVSGADADCTSALLAVLREGAFSWTAASLDDDLIGLIGQIDATQPVLRPALEGVRSSLPGHGRLPGWWPTTTPADGFYVCFDAWKASLPRPASACVYAMLLSEAGRDREAVAIQGQLAGD